MTGAKRRIITGLVISGLASVIGFVIYAEVTIVQPACAAANGFLAAMREGRLDDVPRYSTLDLGMHAKLLEARHGENPVDDEERTLVRLRKAEPKSLGTGQFGGGFKHGCLSTDMADGKPLSIVVKKENERWFVTTVRTEQPPECKSDPP